METSKKPWPIATVFGIREKIDTRPDYQRPAVWTGAQRQLLVDTILRNYDIPKLYWRRTGRKPDSYEVVDGQQRLQAIWGFMAGEFSLSKQADSIDEFDVAGCSYADLPHELRIRYDTYALDVVLVEEADEDEVREMFLRLQNGTSLRAQEKRNAYPGKMRDFVRSLAGHPFFESVGFSNSRFTHDLVAAQLVCLELAGGPANVKDRDLNKMYSTHAGFDPAQAEAKAVRRVLDFLAEVFPEKMPELTRYNVVALYCVTAELLERFVRREFAPVLGPWFLNFESRRAAQEELSEDEGGAEWISYKERISHSTDSEDSIRFRTEFMLRDLLVFSPSLSLKDAQRMFTEAQRRAVFRRDEGRCQLALKCDGVKVRWDDWHCDHRLAWTEGGATTVENAQVSCPACNLAKGKRAA